MKEFESVQEACDYAVLKIVEQRGQCLNDGTCTYGNSKGQHCAVGWLLDPNNENLMSYCGGVFGLLRDMKELAPTIVKNNVDVFDVLQNFHDAESICGRETALKRLHNSHNIDTSKPQYQQWVNMGVQQ